MAEGGCMAARLTAKDCLKMREDAARIILAVWRLEEW
jgi:hypothetical protein